MTQIKICGLTRKEDALMAAGLADELGIISEPSSPRFVADISVLELDPAWKAVTFAVYGPLPTTPVSWLQKVQFIPDWAISPPAELRGKDRPVLRPTSETDWGLVKAWLDQSESTELTLDPFCKGAFGGTGLRLDDRLIEKAMADLGVPLVIAGGLTPSNVAEVIRRHQPWGVDVSSGIEISPGIKDHNLVKSFVDAVRSA